MITEPPLLPLTGETLPAGSNLSDGARLDISCRNLWSPLAKAFIDVRIFNPQAESNWNKSVQQMYNSDLLPMFYDCKYLNFSLKKKKKITHIKKKRRRSMGLEYYKLRRRQSQQQ